MLLLLLLLLLLFFFYHLLLLPPPPRRLLLLAVFVLVFLVYLFVPLISLLLFLLVLLLALQTLLIVALLADRPGRGPAVERNAGEELSSAAGKLSPDGAQLRPFRMVTDYLGLLGLLRGKGLLQSFLAPVTWLL